MPGAKASAAGAKKHVSGHGRLWIVDKDGRVRPIAVEYGLTDGRRTEVAGPEVKDGREVVIGEATDGKRG